MNVLQKFAWFNLAVIGATILLTVSLIPFLGHRAFGGMGMLGFLGFGVLFFWKRPGQVIFDERDTVIQLRSQIVAYAVFWVIFVFAAVLVSPLVYGWEGAVPVSVVQMSVTVAMMILYAMSSICILVQYTGRTSDGQ